MFDEIANDTDVCDNCFRRTHDRYERNYRVGTYRDRNNQIKLWPYKVEDRPDQVFRRDQDTDRIPERGGYRGMVTICECGYRYVPDEELPVEESTWKNRPAGRESFYNYASNLLDRLDEAGTSYDRDEFYSYLDDCRSNDVGKSDDDVYRDAVTHAITVTAARDSSMKAATGLYGD